jgi:hypothetical protein
MLTATIALATVGLAAAATEQKNVPVGFKSEINLEDAGDSGYFEMTSVTNGGEYNPDGNAVYLQYYMTSEVTSASLMFPADNEACPSTQAAADTNLAANAVNITSAMLASGFEGDCMTTAAQTSSWLKYTIDDGPASSLDVVLADSYLTFMDSGNVLQYIPTVITADNEAYRSFEWGINSASPDADSPMETEGPVLPSIQFTPANAQTNSVPYLKVDMSSLTSSSSQVSFCAHQDALYTDSVFNFDSCKTLATAGQAAWFTPSSTGDDYDNNGVWVGKQSGFENGTWYITPFVTGVSESGFFRVAVADGHEPLPASSVGPSLAVAGLVAAVAKALY